MKIAITADIHLRKYEETPERYHALDNILQQGVEEEIDTLLICGDLFDKDFNNYKDFEKLAKKYSNIQIFILPGNHDSRISSRSLIGENIKVIEETHIIEEQLQLMFVPYKQGKSMGEMIADKADEIQPHQWILFSHGDWLDGIRTPNPYEKGIYMPVTRTDIGRYNPKRVILGHIHAYSDGLVTYPGSPCGLDITETGERRFFIYDTEKDILEVKAICSDVIYQILNLLILPVDNEADYIKKQISQKINNWKNKEKTIIRVQVNGYTQNKSELLKILNEELSGYKKYKNEDWNLDSVSVTTEPNRIKIAEKLKEKIDNLALNQSPDEPDREQILIESYRLLFEG
jgi:DNA repair exonuclease SbcCD nuclease subunit